MHKILAFISALLFCYLSIDFIRSAKDDFFFLNYDWDHLQAKEIGWLNLVDYEVNTLSATSSANLPLSNQQTYQIDSCNYFRAERIDHQAETIIFRGIHWINEYPRYVPEKFLLNEVDLPLIQKKGTKIAMIGDSQMVWREGKYTRKWIAKQLNVQFIGEQLDVFGFPYISQNTFTSLQTDSIQKLEDTKVLILFANWKSENLLKLLNRFKGKNVIIVNVICVTLENSTPTKPEPNENFKIINLYDYDKELHFFEGTNYLNYSGHVRLTEDVILNLKAFGIEEN